MTESGLSDATVQHYSSAIDGSLSDLARESSIVLQPLRSIQNQLEFDSISLKIQQLPLFQERDEKGNNMYSAALNKYSNYLATIPHLIDPESNYVLNPSPENKFWLNLSSGRIDGFVNKYGDNFNIVFNGDTDLPGDFYAIPFAIVKPALTDEYQTKDKTGRKRWVASIENHQLKVGRYPTPIDVSQCYGNFTVLDPELPDISVDDQNDYAIENRRIEVEQRQKQSLFRKRVLENFDNRCCLTGFTETEILVASHIVPWRTRIDSRLDPTNGILLFAGYDRMFDLGFFTFDHELTVIIPDNLNLFSGELQKQLQELSGRRAATPLKWSIKSEYLEFHRAEIFSNRISIAETAR